jgi:hypothetical protein
MRRATWNHPSGIQVVAEYWPMAADLQVFTTISADDIAAVWEVVGRVGRRVRHRHFTGDLGGGRLTRLQS